MVRGCCPLEAATASPPEHWERTLIVGREDGAFGDRQLGLRLADPHGELGPLDGAVKIGGVDGEETGLAAEGTGWPLSPDRARIAPLDRPAMSSRRIVVPWSMRSTASLIRATAARLRSPTRMVSPSQRSVLEHRPSPAAAGGRQDLDDALDRDETASRGAQLWRRSPPCQCRANARNESKGRCL